MGRPSRVAPVPRAAAYSTPDEPLITAPATITPSTSAAMDTAQSGRP